MNRDRIGPHRIENTIPGVFNQEVFYIKVNLPQSTLFAKCTIDQIKTINIAWIFILIVLNFNLKLRNKRFFVFFR